MRNRGKKKKHQMMVQVEEDDLEKKRRTGRELCRVCMEKQRFSDDLIFCSKCKQGTHASCLKLPKATLKKIRNYDWTCENCTVCEFCKVSGDESQLLLCDSCDRGQLMFPYIFHRQPSPFSFRMTLVFIFHTCNFIRNFF